MEVGFQGIIRTRGPVIVVAEMIDLRRVATRARDLTRSGKVGLRVRAAFVRRFIRLYTLERSIHIDHPRLLTMLKNAYELLDFGTTCGEKIKVSSLMCLVH